MQLREKMLADEEAPAADMIPLQQTGPQLPDKKSKVAIVVAALICLAYALAMSLSKRCDSNVFILERDPTISFPHVKEQVSVAALEGISIGLPALAIFLSSALQKYKAHNSALASLLNFYLYCGLGLAICLLATDAITNNVKILVLRPRPNFFAYCDYKGYGSAMNSGNYTLYNSVTTANAIGSVSACTASAATVKDSVLSFPSGHSSLSFAAMTYIALLARYTIAQRRPFFLLSFDGLVVIAPFYLSAWIAITRIQDFYHHCDDVMMGSTIGICCSWAVFRCVSLLLSRHVCAEATRPASK